MILRPDANPYVGQPQDQARSGDIVSVAELLHAANVSLDQDTTASGSVSPRYDGINIMVTIEYNMVGIAGNTLRYTYKSRQLSDLQYKIEQVVYANSGATRTVYSRYDYRTKYEVPSIPPTVGRPSRGPWWVCGACHAPPATRFAYSPPSTQPLIYIYTYIYIYM